MWFSTTDHVVAAEELFFADYPQKRELHLHVNNLRNTASTIVKRYKLAKGKSSDWILVQTMELYLRVFSGRHEGTWN